jgi:hypothetical protein
MRNDKYTISHLRPLFVSKGTIFKMTPQGQLTTLFEFTGQGGPFPGYRPLAGLVQGSDGNLYGTCAYGGTYGGGNIFRILMPGPKLGTLPVGNAVVLSWRTNYTGFTLQSSDSLSPPNWVDCTNAPVVFGGHYWATNSLSAGSQFFRLKK